LADAKENMAGTWSVATNMEKSISLLAGIMEVAGKAAKVFTKGSNLDMTGFRRKSNHVWQTLHRDDRT
jgi:beta-glucosidase